MLNNRTQDSVDREEKAVLASVLLHCAQVNLRDLAHRRVQMESSSPWKAVGKHLLWAAREQNP
jgi:hypothetical protein